MAVVALRAAGSGSSIWKGKGASLQLVAAASSARAGGCCEARHGGGGGGGQQKAHQHQSAGHPQPPSGSGKAKKSPAAAPLGNPPGPVEGIDAKSYLWARYHEMKRLVHGEGCAYGRGSGPGLPLLRLFA